MMVLLALFGVLRGVTGRVMVGDREVHPGSPAAAKSVGIALVPEDRKTEGLMLPMSIADNLAIASLDAISTGPFIDRAKESAAVQRGIARLQIKIGAPDDAVLTLSGGNQQKVVLAKWLTADSKVFIFDEPTRGIDIGAKSEIYRLLNELAAQGKSIIMISSELPEVLRMSHRILVMCEGRITGELKAGEATQEAIMHYATQRVTQIQETHAS